MSARFLVLASLLFLSLPLVLAFMTDRAERRRTAVFYRPPVWAGELRRDRSWNNDEARR